MIVFKVMDYQRIEILTVLLKPGPPSPNTVTILDHRDQKLSGIEKVKFLFDAGLYELSFVHNSEVRTATIVSINLEPPPVRDQP